MPITTPSSFSGHILGISAPGWGHLRPLAGLASKIVQERSDILFTLLVVGGFGLRAEQEISKYFPEDSSERPRCNLRVINMGGEGLSPFLTSLLIQNFGPIYSKLANLEPVLCATGKLYDSSVRPTVAIVDFLLPEIIYDIRKVNANTSDVKSLAWISGNVTHALRNVGPEKYGGPGDVETEARELAKATGRDVATIEEELFNPTTGAVLRIPGSPPMFDYELAPRTSLGAGFRVMMLKKANLFMTLCNGMVSATNAAFQSESHEAWQNWFSETNRTYYALGPLQPQSFGTDPIPASIQRSELNSSQKEQLELVEFLDNTLQIHGSNSLLYISFGSIIWPKEEHFCKLIDVLLELKFPFILAHGSLMATIPAEVFAKIKASGIGLLSSWAPQLFILSHPATGWFLTHCGQNSVTEALTQGIPMIAWAIENDEPMHAAQLSLTMDVAFELMEVRTGHGLKPLYRGITPKGTIDAVEAEFYEVFQNARGPVGERKRQNAHALRDVMASAWAEDGNATKAIRKLLNDCFP